MGAEDTLEDLLAALEQAGWGYLVQYVPALTMTWVELTSPTGQRTGVHARTGIAAVVRQAIAELPEEARRRGGL